MTPQEIEALREEACVGMLYGEMEHRFALFLTYAEHYRKLAAEARSGDEKKRLYDLAEQACENALAMVGPGRRSAR